MRTIKFRAWDGERMRPVLTLGLAEGFVCTSRFSSDIEDFEIMQFTGLADKNGAEIYEGDILRDAEGTGVVKWVIEYCAFLVYVREPAGYHRLESDGQLLQTEVIGNIYEGASE